MSTLDEKADEMVSTQETMDTFDEDWEDTNLNRVQELLRELSAPYVIVDDSPSSQENVYEPLEKELIDLLLTVDAESKIDYRPRYREELLSCYLQYAMKPSIAVLEQFVQCDFDLDIFCWQGSAFHLVIKRQLNNVVEIVQFLLDNGADPTGTDWDGASPIDYAIDTFKDDYETRSQLLKMILASPLIKVDYLFLLGLLNHPDAILRSS